jgi:hypothetical protein
MSSSLSDHIMTFNTELEKVEGVRGAATILLYKDGRVDFVLANHQNPFEYVSAVEHFAEASFEPDQEDDTPEQLWDYIEYLTGHC